MFEQLKVTVDRDTSSPQRVRGSALGQLGSSKRSIGSGSKQNQRPKSAHTAYSAKKPNKQMKHKRRHDDFASVYRGLESEELLQVIVHLKESINDFEKERQTMRVELSRLQKECQKQHSQLTNLLSSHAYVHGSTLTEIRQDIEKSTLVRQLKAQVYQLRSEFVAKQTELETLRKSQKTCHLVELTAENEEFLLEMQRLQKIVTDLTGELHRERQERRSDQEAFAAAETRFRNEVTRLTNELNKLAIALEQARAASSTPKQPRKQSTSSPNASSIKDVRQTTPTIGSPQLAKRERPKSAVTRPSNATNGGHIETLTKTVTPPISKTPQRPKSAVSRTAKSVEPLRQPKQAEKLSSSNMNDNHAEIADCNKGGPSSNDKQNQPSTKQAKLLPPTIQGATRHEGQPIFDLNLPPKVENHSHPRQPKDEPTRKRSPRKPVAEVEQPAKQANASIVEVSRDNMPIANGASNANEERPSKDQAPLAANEPLLGNKSTPRRTEPTTEALQTVQRAPPSESSNTELVPAVEVEHHPSIATEKNIIEADTLDSDSPATSKTKHSDTQIDHAADDGHVTGQHVAASQVVEQPSVEQPIIVTKPATEERQDQVDSDVEQLQEEISIVGEMVPATAMEEPQSVQETATEEETFALLADIDNDPDFNKFLDELSDDGDDEGDNATDKHLEAILGATEATAAQNNVDNDQHVAAPTPQSSQPVELTNSPDVAEAGDEDEEEYDADFDESTDAVHVG